MRKIILSEFVTADGVIENPMWTFPYWNDQIANFKFHELFGVDDLLLGRETYDGFAQAWPGRTDEQGYADRINSMPKHVVSTTLTTLPWTNTTQIKDNVEEAVKKLKEQPGQDILIFGSGKLANWLIQRDLIDQYNLLVYPVVLGSGQRLFEPDVKTKLKAVETELLGDVTKVIYTTDRTPDAPQENPMPGAADG